MKQYVKPALLIVFFAALIFLTYFFGLNTYFTVDQIKSNSVALRQVVDDNYLMAVLIFIIAYSLMVIVALPIAIPMTLLAGFLFGVFPGTLYSTIGALIGSIATFLLVRYWIKEFVENRYKEKLKSLRQRFNEYGTSYIIILHYISIVPFFVINALAALSGMSFSTFVMTCIVGSFPLFLIYTFAGQQLNNIQSSQDIFSPTVILALLLLIVIACVPMFVKRKKKDIHL